MAKTKGEKKNKKINKMTKAELQAALEKSRQIMGGDNSHYVKDLQNRLAQLG